MLNLCSQSSLQNNQAIWQSASLDHVLCLMMVNWSFLINQGDDYDIFYPGSIVFRSGYFCLSNPPLVVTSTIPVA